MHSRLLLPPLVIVGLLCLLVTGELVAGTSLYFVLMMSVATFAACVTYNLLGGLGTIAGFGFSGFALGTLIVGQIGKAVLLEKADQNLYVPQLTIKVYAVYYVALLAGTFLFARLRVPLPRPAEPETPTQAQYLYVVSLIGGLVGTTVGFLSLFQGEAGTNSLTHGISLILGFLLPFSLVLAVDHRLRITDGRHFFGWMAFWPTLVMEVQGFLWGSRQGFVEPFAIIFLTCYLRNFRFQKRHLAIATGLGTVFFLFVSPFYLYARGARESPTLGELATTMIQTLEQAPSKWSSITYDVGNAAVESDRAVNYFDSPGAVTLNRFALIGPDSTLIRACSTGFRYGFTTLRLDFLSEIPRFLYPGKPEYGSGHYLGQLDGQESDLIETTSFTTITPVSDSFGSFGWLSVVLFPFLVMPAIFVVYESMFDVSRAWGTVATLSLGFGIAGGSMGVNITGTLIKSPFYILAISWGAMLIVRMIPTTGDRTVAVRRDSLDSGPFGVGHPGE
jgi:hypothetical protein